MGRESNSGDDLEEVGAGGRVDHLKHGTRVWIYKTAGISPVDRKEPIKGLFTWRWGGVKKYPSFTCNLTTPPSRDALSQDY